MEIQVAPILILGGGIDRGTPRVKVELASVATKVEVDDRRVAEGAEVPSLRDPEGEGTGRMVRMLELIEVV